MTTNTDQDEIQVVGKFYPAVALETVRRLSRGRSIYLHVRMDAELFGDPDHVWPFQTCVALEKRAALEMLKDMARASDGRVAAGKAALLVTVHASKRCLFIR